MVAERQFRSTLDVAVETLRVLAVDIMSIARTRHVCSAVEMVEDWVTNVENIATQRFETLAHEIKTTKVRLTELKDLKSQLRFDILDDDKDQLSNTDGRIEAVEKFISELDESVAHTVPQEGIQERIVGEIMDVPVPQMAEQMLEVPKIIPQDRILQRTVKQTEATQVLQSETSGADGQTYSLFQESCCFADIDRSQRIRNGDIGQTARRAGALNRARSAGVAHFCYHEVWCRR